MPLSSVVWGKAGLPAAERIMLLLTCKCFTWLTVVLKEINCHLIRSSVVLVV